MALQPDDNLTRRNSAGSLVDKTPLYAGPPLSNVTAMSTIIAILQPDADGTVHLPVPAPWRHLPIRVKAELEPVAGAAEPQPSLKGFGCLRGKISMSPDFDEPLEDFKDYLA